MSKREQGRVHPREQVEQWEEMWAQRQERVWAMAWEQARGLQSG
jgi:hypothetical protein